MYDKFHGYLVELGQNFSKLAELLQEKLGALEKFDINKLDSVIKEEQVFVLLSKGFDSNVAAYREKLGLKGEKLSDIIEELPPEEQGRFRDTFISLKAALEKVKALNMKCQDLIQERLYSLDKTIKELDRTAGTAYSKPGSDSKRPGESAHLFTKSV